MSDRPRLLVGDIGGTHGRFAMAGDDLSPVDAAVEDGDAHASFEEALAAYLEKSGVRAEAAAFAVAGPVTDGRSARITNRQNWAIDAAALERRFGLARVIVMNDFVAQAASLPHLADDQLVRIGAAEPKHRCMKVAVGPGTGLGVAGLLPEGHGWRPLQSEGGHVEFAPTDDREWAAFCVIRREGGRVEAESVLSGPGLMRLHRALAEVDGGICPETSPAEIVEAANGGTSRAGETVAMFLSMLARFCGDLALTFTAEGGVYVCGGVVPKMQALLDPPSFRAAFEAKQPHDDMMRGFATSLVVSPVAGLVGCAAEAGRLLRRL